MSGKKYKVMSSLRFNGDKFDKDDSVELEDKDAKPLLDAGVIQDPKKAPPKRPAPGTASGSVAEGESGKNLGKDGKVK